MLVADPMTIAALPDEATFKDRVRRTRGAWRTAGSTSRSTSTARASGASRLRPAQPASPPGRAHDRHRPPGAERGKGHGREALALLADWLFEHAGAVRIESPTDPANVPMRRVFEHVGWELVGTYNEFDREWVMYAITRERWAARHEA